MSRNELDSYQFKIVLIGDPNVGKSSLLSRFSKNEFSLEPKVTLGIELATRAAAVDDIPITLQVWDTFGQENFQEITRSYFRGALGVLIAFDISTRTTFDDLGKWIQMARENAEEGAIMMLVGCKSDLNFLRQVTTEEATNYAAKQNMIYIETSALNTSGVETVFEVMTAEIYKLFLANGGLERDALASKGRKSVKLGLKEIASSGKCFGS